MLVFSCLLSPLPYRFLFLALIFVITLKIETTGAGASVHALSPPHQFPPTAPIRVVSEVGRQCTALSTDCFLWGGCLFDLAQILTHNLLNGSC